MKKIFPFIAAAVLVVAFGCKKSADPTPYIGNWQNGGTVLTLTSSNGYNVASGGSRIASGTFTVSNSQFSLTDTSKWCDTLITVTGLYSYTVYVNGFNTQMGVGLLHDSCAARYNLLPGTYLKRL